MVRLLAAVALGIGTLAAGCERDPEGPPVRSVTVRPASASPDTSAADTLIVLERYYTFNNRRAYVVRIEPGGVVRYEDRASTPSPTLRLDPPRVETDTLERGATRRLVAAFEAAGFEAFPDSLLGGTPPCGPTRTDGGLARVALSVGGRTKQVFHELACPAAASASMRALEVAIDRAAGSERWTGAPE